MGITRKEAIKELKDLKQYCKDTFLQRTLKLYLSALDIAISSLETDEAYQLEYELTTKPTIEEFIEYAQKEYGVTINAVKSDNPDTFEKLFGTTKNDLAVDTVSRKAVHDMLENLPITVEDKWFNWLQKACMRLAELPPVTPQEPKTGHWIVDGLVDCYLDKVRCHCSECGKNKKFPANYDHIKKEFSISYKYPDFIDNYCPNCGAKMVEPQKSEDE